MQNEIEMLRSIRQSTEMGCSGIRAVLPEAQNPAMQSALRSQWKEYDSIYAEADRLLRERGVRLSGVNPLAKYGSMLTAKLRVRSSRNTTARIAEMLVQGNTRGMVKSMQNLRAMGVLDPKVSSLTTRLLQTEQAYRGNEALSLSRLRARRRPPPVRGSSVQAAWRPRPAGPAPAGRAHG